MVLSPLQVEAADSEGEGEEVSDELVKCEECGEWTHPRPDGSKRCPKHLKTAHVETVKRKPPRP